MISLDNTKLDLQELGLENKKDTQYYQDLPLYLSSLFPMLKAGDANMFVMGWGSVPDPDRWTYRLFTPGSTMNFSQYDNAKVTEALELGRTLSDPAARAKAYRTASPWASASAIHSTWAINTAPVLLSTFLGRERSRRTCPACSVAGPRARFPRICSRVA